MVSFICNISDEVTDISMSLEVEYFLVDSATSLNRYVVLTNVPDGTGNVALDIIGGTSQLYRATVSGGDFMVDSSKVRWDYPTSPLYPWVGIGDRLRVIYDRS